MMVKQQVDLTERAIFSFGKAEPTPDVAKQVGACVEERGFGTPIPCCKIKIRKLIFEK